MIVISVVEYSPQVFFRLCQPHNISHRHAFPNAHPQWATDIQAGHHLRETNDFGASQFNERREIKFITPFTGNLIAQCSGMLRVADDLKLPCVSS